MAYQKKQPEPEIEAGAPEWMVTFSDCMTLLLTFFVLLLTFSSFDDKVYSQMQDTPFQELPSLYEQKKRARSNVMNTIEIKTIQDSLQGSEKSTSSDSQKSSLINEGITQDHHRKKIFIADSTDIFWANSMIMSPEGKKTLASLAAFLSRIEGRIIITETPVSNTLTDNQQGLMRSWKIMDYLTNKAKVEKNRCSISQHSAIDLEHDETGNNTNQRRVEIVVLEDSLCN